MPTHSERRVVPYTARQMYDLVADVASYPEFLPWCAAARVRGRHALPDLSAEIMDVDMVISFKLFRERFGTRVTFPRDALRIVVNYLDGPFRHLNNSWDFHPLPDGRCEVDFHVDFEFRSVILQKVIGLVFYEAMQRIITAFEKRANALYGGASG
ncbi:MAG: type II toxin-antitoxin system RatA family toxin [Paracoccaceae bacterium]